ncbi:hypothetical protein [Bradyrhizobium ottawaense]|uniref:hypothetical protein n=1 Tax=Bradyrhizobium ottawaense TaxID=931866 RepID=UPI003518399D
MNAIGKCADSPAADEGGEAAVRLNANSFASGRDNVAVAVHRREVSGHVRHEREDAIVGRADVSPAGDPDCSLPDDVHAGAVARGDVADAVYPDTHSGRGDARIAASEVAAAGDADAVPRRYEQCVASSRDVAVIHDRRGGARVVDVDSVECHGHVAALRDSDVAEDGICSDSNGTCDVSRAADGNPEVGGGQNSAGSGVDVSECRDTYRGSACFGEHPVGRPGRDVTRVRDNDVAVASSRPLVSRVNAVAIRVDRAATGDPYVGGTEETAGRGDVDAGAAGRADVACVIDRHVAVGRGGDCVGDACRLDRPLREVSVDRNAATAATVGNGGDA